VPPKMAVPFMILLNEDCVALSGLAFIVWKMMG